MCQPRPPPRSWSSCRHHHCPELGFDADDTRTKTTHSRPWWIPSWRRTTSILHVELTCWPWYPSHLPIFPRPVPLFHLVTAPAESRGGGAPRLVGKTKAGGRRESRPPTKASCWIPTQRSCVLCWRGVDNGVSSTALTWCCRRGLILHVFLLFFASFCLLNVYASRHKLVLLG
jgi:hypothetical protein